MNTIQVPLKNREGRIVAHSIIDEIDAPLLRWNWSLVTTGYARRGTKCKGKHTVVKLHGAVASAPKGLDVDHINGNRLDNRRSNLRICTRSENLTNRKGPMPASTSGIRGVSFDKARGKWVAHAKQNKKFIYRKRFDSREEAQLAIIEVRRRFGFLEGAAL